MAPSSVWPRRLFLTETRGMDGWMDGWMDGLMEGGMEREWREGCMDGWIDW